MVCRSTPGMSVPMGLANIDSGLDDDQIQSLVHQLRHEYAEGHHAAHQTEGAASRHPTVDPSAAWDRFRASTATRITGHPDLRPQRRAGLLRRITQADQTAAGGHGLRRRTDPGPRHPGRPADGSTTWPPRPPASACPITTP